MLGAVALSQEAPTRRERGRRPLCGGIGEAFAAAPPHLERFQRGSAAAPAKAAAAAAAIRCCHRRRLGVDKGPHTDSGGRSESWQRAEWAGSGRSGCGEGSGWLGSGNGVGRVARI